MPDPREKLQNMFHESQRYKAFGDVIVRMLIQGFRSHQNTIINIESPVTAFCGPNGSGKSTILQLAAMAYRSSSNYSVSSFFIRGTIDPSPYADNSLVQYSLWKEDSYNPSRPSTTQQYKTITISRRSKWSYGDRIARNVFFAGVGLYLPKIDRPDFMVREAGKLVISQRRNLDNSVLESASRILSWGYNEAFHNDVNYKEYKGNILTVDREGKSYSESHMGYGEGRIFRLVADLESIPDRSLVLIEEPEISLHQKAQYGLGRYLVDVAVRKRHQIMITTHSEYILNALRPESRIYLHRRPDGMIVTVPRVTTLMAKSMLAEGHTKALLIMVEDEIASHILRNIIRRIDATFLQLVGIYPAGAESVIRNLTPEFRKMQLPIVSVLDGDMTDNPTNDIYKLPGSQAPEKELCLSTTVKRFILQTYSLSMDDFLASVSDVDHHGWLSRLARRLNVNEDGLVGEMAREYVNSLNESELLSLVTLLKEATEARVM